MTVMTTGSAVPNSAVLGMPAPGAPAAGDGSAAFAQALSSASAVALDPPMSNIPTLAMGDTSTMTTVVSPTVPDAAQTVVPGVPPGKASGTGAIPSVPTPMAAVPEELVPAGVAAPAPTPEPADGSVPKRKDQTRDLEAPESTAPVQGQPIQPALTPVQPVNSDSVSPALPTTASSAPSPAAKPLSATDNQPVSSAGAPASDVRGQLPAPNAADSQPISSEAPTVIAVALPAEKLFAAVVSVAVSSADPAPSVVKPTAVRLGVTSQDEDKLVSANPPAAKGDVKTEPAKFGGLASDPRQSTDPTTSTVPAVSAEPIAGKLAKSSADTSSDQGATIENPVTPTSSGVHVRSGHLAATDVSNTFATANPSVSSAHADAVEVAHQLGRHIAGARLSSLTHDRPMHLSVLLHPEDLGEVSVQLTLASGRIDVQVSSQSDTTRDMLRQGMQDLRRQLSDSGVSVGDMDVSDGWSQQSNSSQNNPQSADQRSSQQSRLPGLPAPSSSRMTTPEQTAVHRPSRTGIDILA